MAQAKKAAPKKAARKKAPHLVSHRRRKIELPEGVTRQHLENLSEIIKQNHQLAEQNRELSAQLYKTHLRPDRVKLEDAVAGVAPVNVAETVSENTGTIRGVSERGDDIPNGKNAKIPRQTSNEVTRMQQLLDFLYTTKGDLYSATGDLVGKVRSLHGQRLEFDEKEYESILSSLKSAEELNDPFGVAMHSVSAIRFCIRALNGLHGQLSEIV